MKTILAGVLFFALVAVAGGYFLFAHGEAPGSEVQAELAGVKFRYARDEATGSGGLSDRLGFLAAFPTFAPVKSAPDPRAVTVTLTAKEEGLAPAERPSKLYARFLTPETFSGPGGLIERHFEEGSPYDSEALLIAPPDGKNFFARCPKPQAGAPGEACISLFREGALDVELRYAPALLEHWDALIDGAHAMLAKMTAPPRRAKR